MESADRSRATAPSYCGAGGSRTGATEGEPPALAFSPRARSLRGSGRGPPILPHFKTPPEAPLTDRTFHYNPIGIKCQADEVGSSSALMIVALGWLIVP